MSIVIKKTGSGDEIARRVREMTGVDLDVCYQCKKCTSGCPVGGFVKSPPSEIMRRLHLGADSELLDAEIIWTCVSCETCSSRCPMGIDIAAVMDALRHLALEKGAAVQEGNVPLFNRAFLKTVQLFGRTYEIAMIGAYKLGTGKFMADTDKLPGMLKKGKLALLPSLKGDRKTVKRIFKKAAEKKAAGKKGGGK